MSADKRTVLWWGRYDRDYSRNRILRQAFRELGWQVAGFKPLLSRVGDIEAVVRGVRAPDLVFVPCFRQRDLAAARRYARRRGVPLMADPLISAYDKQVNEREKFPADSRRAARLLRWESARLKAADRVLADTREHARYFAATLGVAPERLHVVHVGAEQPLFAPAAEPKPPGRPVEVLFFGSFIGLQGPGVIVDAARALGGAGVRWTLLGSGPLLAKCKQKAQGLENVVFESWVPYKKLPERIRQADILLGVFGHTAKAGRVIPNKIYQAIACGKPVVTRMSLAYPAGLVEAADSGLTFVPAANPKALAKAVSHLAVQPERLPSLGAQARASYEKYFSDARIRQELEAALAGL
jgi:glycosyltransferase involved in cell wall biosynthesis